MNAAKSNIQFLLAVPKAANAQDDVSSFVPVPSTVTFFKHFIQLVAFQTFVKIQVIFRSDDGDYRGSTTPKHRTGRWGGLMRLPTKGTGRRICGVKESFVSAGIHHRVARRKYDCAAAVNRYVLVAALRSRMHGSDSDCAYTQRPPNAFTGHYVTSNSSSPHWGHRGGYVLPLSQRTR